MAKSELEYITGEVILGQDWTEIKKLPDTDFKLSNKTQPFENLGLSIKDRDKKTYYTKGYVGVTRLKDKNNCNILCPNTNKEYILNIKPRFEGLNPIKMINELKDDDEFLIYLSSDKKEDINNLEDNTLFHFYENEAPIEIDGGFIEEGNIISTVLYINLLTEICKRNLMGKMQKHEENLTGKVKGKIMFNKNINSNLVRGRKDRIYCQYQVYSIDILENQILKYGLYKAKKIINEFFREISSDIKRNIAYCEKALENVTFRKISLQEINISKVSGFYSNYKQALKFAKMLIEGVSIDAYGNVKKVCVTPYAINMQKLFEFYIRKVIKNEIKDKYKNDLVLEPYDKKFNILYENRDKKDRKLFVETYLADNVIPDILLRYQDGKYMALDVKYKRYDKYDTRDDTLQILAYGMLFDCEHIGLILPEQIIDSPIRRQEYRLDIRSSDKNNKKYYHEIIISEENKRNILSNIIISKCTKK
ncbi:5-methylcytosine restriction system specificity protein McrC [Romboutsia sp.]|uniref:5-methylcytosine restriction system specificity protein McrC n=1 Tax=Romboutsia sp. TaxID=1965302 RepID=UPI003F3AF021